MQMNISLPQGAKLSSNVAIIDIVGRVIFWLFLAIITFGLALYIAFYYFHAYVINQTSVVDADDNKVGQLKCELDFSSVFGRAILWWLLTVVTFGIALFFYYYRVIAYTLNNTEVVIHNP